MNKLNRFLTLGLAAVFIPVILLYASVRAAAGKIYITPDTSTLTNGSEVELTVRIDPGIEVNGVQLEITYETSMLKLVSVDVTNTAFPNVIDDNFLTSPITSTRSTSSGSPVNTDSEIFKLKFKVLAESGSTNISVTGNAAMEFQPTNPETQGAVINISDAHTAPGNQQSSGGSAQTSPSQVGAPSPTGNQNNQDGTGSTNRPTEPIAAGNDNEPPIIIGDNSSGKGVTWLLPLGFAIAGISLIGLVAYFHSRHDENDDGIPPALATPVTYNEDLPLKSTHKPTDPKLEETIDRLPEIHNPDPGSTVEPNQEDKHEA